MINFINQLVNHLSTLSINLSIIDQSIYLWIQRIFAWSRSLIKWNNSTGDFLPEVKRTERFLKNSFSIFRFSNISIGTIRWKTARNRENNCLFGTGSNRNPVFFADLFRQWKLTIWPKFVPLMFLLILRSISSRTFKFWKSSIDDASWAPTSCCNISWTIDDEVCSASIIDDVCLASTDDFCLASTEDEVCLVSTDDEVCLLLKDDFRFNSTNVGLTSKGFENVDQVLTL